MKPAENLPLYRTVGDTDPFYMRLIVTTDEGDVPVPDTATVRMHIRTSPVITLPGIARGTGQGYWKFETGLIEDVASMVVEYEVEVIEGGGMTYTVVKNSHIYNLAQIA